jgi:xylulokinase
MGTDKDCAFIGIDVGTSGVRGVAVSPAGQLLAEAEETLRQDRRAPGGIHEQDPCEWWQAVCAVCQVLVKGLKARAGNVVIGGAAVTSTSGSLVVTDAEGRPLRPALLYDDSRGAEIASELNRQGGGRTVRLGPSFSLVKAAWVAREEPKLWKQTRYILHPADWLSGKLTGVFGVSDFTNALKLGYDPENRSWTGSVQSAGLLCDRLPAVRRPAERIGQVESAASAETGLPVRTPVMAGATDGMASLIASGAGRRGDADTTLGTTIVWKVLHDAKPAVRGGIYYHLHPGGLWVPGAASNTGMGSLARPDAATSLPEMDRLAARCSPTRVICYRLPGQGERFPFVNPEARSFVEGNAQDPAEFHAAQLQSIGFVERWGYETIEQCGVEIGDRVFSTGAAARSTVLSQLRASILGKTVIRTRYPTAAFGAAILAATGAAFRGSIFDAIQSMTTILESHDPAAGLVPIYTEIYGAFRDACARRGYIA